jgi:hypothetical protein
LVDESNIDVEINDLQEDNNNKRKNNKGDKKNDKTVNPIV